MRLRGFQPCLGRPRGAHGDAPVAGDVEAAGTGRMQDDPADAGAGAAQADLGRAPLTLREVGCDRQRTVERDGRSEEHTSELQSLMRNSYAVFCLTKKKITNKDITMHNTN